MWIVQAFPAELEASYSENEGAVWEHSMDDLAMADEQMELRCVLAVVRHGDRTPKQKMKMVVNQVRPRGLWTLASRALCLNPIESAADAARSAIRRQGCARRFWLGGT